MVKDTEWREVRGTLGRVGKGTMKENGSEIVLLSTDTYGNPKTCTGMSQPERQWLSTFALYLSLTEHSPGRDA